MIKATNIVWDTDGISIDDLPEEVAIKDDIEVEEIADYLSDVYGWCVESFNIELDLYDDILQLLTSALSSDYARQMVEDEAFVCAVQKDVEETSAWQDEGYYTDDDIRLAIGRVLTEKLDIE